MILEVGVSELGSVRLPCASIRDVNGGLGEPALDCGLKSEQLSFSDK